MPVISTNTAADTAVRYLNLNAANESSALAKLSSGSRIVQASDDAAGLAISTRISSDVTTLQQAATNASQATSILQTADGGASNSGTSGGTNSSANGGSANSGTSGSTNSSASGGGNSGSGGSANSGTNGGTNSSSDGGSTNSGASDGSNSSAGGGTNSSASCSPKLRESVAGILEASGKAMVVDGRFKGGWITRAYGRPSEGVDASQLELACRAYMREPERPSPGNWPTPIDEARAAPTRATVRRVLEAMLERLSQ